MTAAELAFVNRMALHVEQGLSFEDAAKAVLADDQRIAAAFGVWQSTKRDDQKQLCSELSAHVYRSIRQA